MRQWDSVTAIRYPLSAIGYRLAAGISSGGFMRRLSRSVLFCPLHRGKSGAARIGGDERSEPIRRMVILPYDTESQSRNVLASPLGEEGHEVSKGCTRVRMIMILDVDVTADWRLGPRWSILSVLCPVHPFPLRGTSPQGETRSMERKNRESYTSRTISAFSPFGGWRHHLSPASGSTITRAYCRAAYEESVSRCFILPPA